jgi:hypothetical protein
MVKNTANPEPTGGWQQYRFALFVLLFYALFMLGTTMAIVFLVPHFRGAQRPNEEVVSRTDHEPFHFSISVLPSLNPAGEGGK